MTVAEIIKDGPTCEFVMCRGGVLRYETSAGYQFDVPIAELGGVAVVRHEKTITFMKWIAAQVKP